MARMSNAYPPQPDPSMAGLGFGMDPTTQLMIMAMLGQGDFASMNAPAFNVPQMQSLMGMVPTQNPSGSPLTASTQANILGDYSNLLFDPAMAAFAGTDAYSPQAFEPTTTTEIVQSPELQSIYGYLRDRESFEGRIATELMEGGTAMGAVGKIRQFMADASRNSEADLAVKNRLALELPPALDSITGQPMPVTPDGLGVNWMEAQNQARDIGEQWAGIPSIGPTGPVMDAQGNVVSEGGERMWSTDDSGAPVMINVQTKPSPLGKKFEQLGLSSPYEQYTPEDFMTPDQIALQQQYDQSQPVIDQMMQEYLNSYARESDIGNQRVRPGVNRPEALGGGSEAGMVTGTPATPAATPAGAGTQVAVTPAGNVRNPVSDEAFDRQLEQLRPSVILPNPDGTWNDVAPLVQYRAADFGWTPEQQQQAIRQLNQEQRAEAGALSDTELGGTATGSGGAGRYVQKPAAYGMMRKQRTGEEPGPTPPVDPDFLRQLGITPTPPPVDPNAPVMNAVQPGQPWSAPLPSSGPYYDPTTSDRRAEAQRQ